MKLFQARTFGGALVLLLSLTQPAKAEEPASDDVASPSRFRVNPYLQQPTSRSMLVTWFTETPDPGRIVLYRNGRRVTGRRSRPEYQPWLEYSQLELDQGAAGLDYFPSNANYKHSVRVSGLRPDTAYFYAVYQGADVRFGVIQTAPNRRRWDNVRFIALADSETQPQGRVTNRAWIPPPQAPGSEGRPALPVSNAPGEGFAAGYLLTESEGYRQNLRIIGERNPDFIMMPGDIVQGGGYQMGWDEFFRHNAGVFDSPLSSAPILPALGNWENFGGPNGGYTISADPANPTLVKLDAAASGPGSVNAPFVGRSKYKVYFDQPSNGHPDEQDNYYRVDYGPVTVLTLDSSNGEPDVLNANRENSAFLDTDTQTNFTRAEFEAAGGTGLSDFNPGSRQYRWVLEQLEDARRKRQIVFVQFHHVAYSTGRHSIPIGQFFASGQSGTPLRFYQEIFERYGVVSVLSGHNEQFERSFVDLDGDGVGVHHYDVGMAGDGFGVPLSEIDTLFFGADIWQASTLNPFRSWTAWLDEPEMWTTAVDADGTAFRKLVDGGIHYGHLEVNVDRIPRCRGRSAWAKVRFTPVYSFPRTDANYQLVGNTERRVYDDELTVYVGRDGRPLDDENPLDCALD